MMIKNSRQMIIVNKCDAAPLIIIDCFLDCDFSLKSKTL